MFCFSSFVSWYRHKVLVFFLSFSNAASAFHPEHLTVASSEEGVCFLARAMLELLSDWVDNLSLCVGRARALSPADPTSSIWRDKSSSDLTAPLCPPYAQTRLCVTLQTVSVTVCPLALRSPGISVCVCVCVARLCVLSLAVHETLFYFYFLLLCVHAWRGCASETHLWLREAFYRSFFNTRAKASSVASASCRRERRRAASPPIVVPLVRQTAHNRDCLSIRGHNRALLIHFTAVLLQREANKDSIYEA